MYEWVHVCVCVCECLRKSLKDSPRQGKKPSNRKQAEAAGSGQAELKMLKHCLTQRAPLEFHLPPARSHSYSHTHTHRHTQPLLLAEKKWGNFHPWSKAWQALGIYCLPLSYGLPDIYILACGVCVFVCTCFSLYEWVCVWIVKTLWLVLFRMALYCCIFYFATKCIKHKIYCEFTNAVLWFFIAEHLTAFRGWGE